MQLFLEDLLKYKEFDSQMARIAFKDCKTQVVFGTENCNLLPV